MRTSWHQGMFRSYSYNWLRVSCSAKMPEVDKRVRHQLHAVVPLLDVFESQQQSLEFILPGKGPLHAKSQRMNGGIEQPLPSTLRDLAIARVLFDVRNEPRV